jgi:hypothetical protein
MLCIVAMLMVALVVSANLSRAGPDMVFDSEVENITYLVNASQHDIGTVEIAAEQLAIERSTMVVSSSVLIETRSNLVESRNLRDITGNAYNDIATSPEFRFTHRSENGWRVLRT